MKSFSLEHYEKLESYIPVDLLSTSGFLLAFLVICFFIVFRYFLLVGAAYFIYWRKIPFSLPGKVLHDKELPKKQIANEIRYSLISSLIFALSGLILGILWQEGLTQIYTKFNEFSLWYLALSFVVLTIIHEVYFYFTHVWMHKPGLYQKIHAVHHASVKTSPWASFSFHPYEAIVHAVFLPLMAVVIPLHPVIIIVYLTFMTLTAISNHLGVEIIGYKWMRDLFISGEHHSLHHKRMKINFGLYYTFMDKIMGTEFDGPTKKTN